MIRKKSILILEDDLATLTKILDRLNAIEEKQGIEFVIAVLSTYLQVAQYINKNPHASFDLILLDRDCKLGGSFHVLDIERFDPKKVIGISSVPEYNEEAKKRGVSRIVWKDYEHLDDFADKLSKSVTKFLTAS